MATEDKVPMAVQKQLDRANELEAQRKSVLGPTGVEKTPVAEAPDELVPGNTGIGQGPGDSPQPQTDWQQIAQTEAGRLRVLADQNALNAAQLQAYDAREQELKQQLSDVTARLNESVAVTQASDMDLMITEMEQDPERADEAQMLRRLNERSIAQEQKIARLENVRENQALTAADRFWKALGEKIPDRFTLEKDPAFDAWASTVDKHIYEMTGQTITRQQMLEKTVREVTPDNIDESVLRITNLFDQFRQLSKQSSSQTFDPDPAASNPPLGAQEKIMWTPAKVKQFYLDRQHGKYTKPGEAEALEADLNRALNEGRWKA